MSCTALHSVEAHLPAEAYSHQAVSDLLGTVFPAPQEPMCNALEEQPVHVLRSHPPSPRTFQSQVTKKGSTYPFPKGLSCSPDVTRVTGSRGGGHCPHNEAQQESALVCSHEHRLGAALMLGHV